MATIGTKLYTWLKGEKVGEDVYGNRYYRSRKKQDGARIGRMNIERRWVVYKGLAEPSKVPAAWHGWLHYISNDVPDAATQSDKLYAWEKEHMPNVTGTDLAYRPPGHISQGGQRDKATGDYEAWSP